MPKTITVYAYSELSDEAKEKAREWYRIHGLDYEWWDCVEDDFKEIMAILGFDISKTYFRGFWSQGDGASFEGSYSYAAGWFKKLSKYFEGWDAEFTKFFFQLGRDLQEFQRPTGYSFRTKLIVRGYYCHDGCMMTDEAMSSFGKFGEEFQYASAEQETAFLEFARRAARWYYRRLEEEYEALSSDGSVDEVLTDSDWAFFENGDFNAY